MAVMARPRRGDVPAMLVAARAFLTRDLAVMVCVGLVA
jgi:hypothetical protein